VSSPHEFAHKKVGQAPRLTPSSLFCTCFQVIPVLVVIILACPFFMYKKGSTPAIMQAAVSADVAAPNIT